jgi:hypothetical protein
MQAWALGLLLLAALGFLAWRTFQRPRGVYLRSAAGVLIVTFGWALFWLVVSPSNEAGFGFFAIWVVLVALAVIVAFAACLGATVRHVADALKAP